MKPGPLPKPAHLRSVQRGGKPPAKPPVRPVSSRVPSPPSSLRGEARAEWRRVVPVLAASGLLERADRAVLTAYCLTWARLLEAEAALAEGGGMICRGSHGGEQPRAEIRIARDASSLLCRFAGELGLTPAARVRLGATAPATPEHPSDFPLDLVDGTA